MSEAFPILDCVGCGACCMHMAVPPFIDEHENLPDEVLADYREAVHSRELQFAVHGVDEIPCAWFDMVTRRCRHYEHRPKICRDFDMGGDDCRRMREQAGFDL